MRLEPEFNRDILQPIPLEEWPLLQKLLKVDWPKYALYYYWIQNSIIWKKRDPKLALQIYCPHGKYQNDATFVGISNFSYWNVIVFTKELSGQKLHNAIIKTKRIDWSKKITFAAVDEHSRSILFSASDILRTDQGIEMDEFLHTCVLIKSADDCAHAEIKVPEECYLRELNPSDLPMVHSSWLLADKEEPEKSLKFLETAVTLNKSMGLFLKEGDVLVSTVLQTDWLGLGSVQTLEAYKRRGYAKIVVNALAKKLGQEGISPVLAVVCGNIPSENMFQSLNWKRTVPATWVVTKKLPRNSN